MSLLNKQEVLKAIDDEPEYPGDAPPRLMQCIRDVLALDEPEREKAVLLIARLAVKQTKQCITKRINTLTEVAE